RTRAFGILFSHCHLHHPQHRAQLASVDLPTLTIFKIPTCRDHAFKLGSMTMSLISCDVGVVRGCNRRRLQAVRSSVMCCCSVRHLAHVSRICNDLSPTPPVQRCFAASM